MPITIVKYKPKTQAKEELKAAPKNEVEVLEPEKLSNEELVDQYGRLQNEIVRLQANPVYAQFALVEAEIKTRLEAYEPEDVVHIKGHHYMLEAGACAKEQRKVIDVMRVLDWLGSDTFCKIAKVGVADAEKYLTVDQFEKVVSVPGFTANRKFKLQHIAN